MLHTFNEWSVFSSSAGFRSCMELAATLLSKKMEQLQRQPRFRSRAKVNTKSRQTIAMNYHFKFKARQHMSVLAPEAFSSKYQSPYSVLFVAGNTESRYPELSQKTERINHVYKQKKDVLNEYELKIQFKEKTNILH